MRKSNPSRRTFLKSAAAGGAGMLAGPFSPLAQERPRKPNIIYILADDLGYNELGCYGQTKIRTPRIDGIAAEGMRFTQHYSGSPVCAPSRCALLTGRHTGHGYIRDNDEMGERGDVWRDPTLEGQRPLLPDTATIGTMLKEAGYTTACIGKWGLGGPESTGHPLLQGLDHFYGYLCQRVAHNYYPTHLWRNKEKHILEGNATFHAHQKLPEDRDAENPDSYRSYAGSQYAPDLMLQEALQFIRRNRGCPFFLYFATPVPHLALQVPEDSLREYEDAFPETPYRGEKGYLPHRRPRAAYAAMITRMDRDIGLLMDLLRELGLERDTLVMFSSDNGPTYTGGADTAFFNSAGELRGLKGELYEGGIRVPMIARWPGRIPKGSRTGHVSSFWDVLPTLAELVGSQAPANIDGISFLPTLLQTGSQRLHDHLYWEYHARPSQAVRAGNWKAVRRLAGTGPSGEIALYDLANDFSEKHDVAATNSEVVRRMESIMASRTRSEIPKWNFK